VLREEEEEMPVVAVQAKVFTMEIVKKKRRKQVCLEGVSATLQASVEITT
jgi:uncharacterized protein (UPF0128 family)